jgi:2-keto-4-pentenoate hydratase
MTDTISAIADELDRAERERVPVAPLTTRHDGFSLADAYAVQQHNVVRRLGEEATLVGRKVGLTSRAMQEMLGVDEPDFGSLLDGMLVEEGDDVALETLIQPRVEAEIALVLADDLRGPGVTTVAAARAVAGALPALEIIDSRIADWQIALADTVADNASCGRIVLGGRVTPIDRLDLRLVGMAVWRNGELADSGAGAAVLGNPLRCVAWLANKLAAFDEGLRAGDLVLAGALHRAFAVGEGDGVRAEFAHLGAVSARFVTTQGDAR